MSPLDDDSPQHKDSAEDSDDLNSGSLSPAGQKELPGAYALLDPSPNGGHNEVRRLIPHGRRRPFVNKPEASCPEEQCKWDWDGRWLCFLSADQLLSRS